MEQNYDEKIKEVKSSLNKLKTKKNKKNSLTRKERAAHLIQKGALLEIAGIDDVDSETLLGYFLWFKDV
ncbi:conjugal transfer protein TraD, partial [Fusobacterium vincentii]|uniref:conjugal transfer protein TraD n=2 Tax=Fusobacteriaceae TaxID=203492 RepID=UPI00372EB2DD